MKHVELEVGDVVIESSSYGRIGVVVVSKITPKTVETVSRLGSRMRFRHGEHFGDILYVYNEQTLNKIKEIEQKISDLGKEREELRRSLERVIIGEL